MASSERRILALLFPRLPVDRLKRRWKVSGKLDKRPLVVAGKSGNILQLMSVDTPAAKLGLYPGKALADARAMVPDLAVIRANEPADRKLLEAVADWCARYTPLVALDPPCGLFLDVTRVAHLFGGENALLEDAARKIASQGFLVHAALAGTAEAARALAQYKPGTVVPPGGEAGAVAPLPTDALNTEPHIIYALKRAGLKTVGQVAGRMRQELASRFGSSFVLLLERTCGRNGGPITPRTPLPTLMAERRFAEPVTDEAAIVETLLSLSNDITVILEPQGRGARILEAWFFRADGQVRHVTIETGRAIREPTIIVRLFQERLDALIDPLDPGFGFDLIRLSVLSAQAITAENIGFDTRSCERDVAFLVDRLAARLGAQRILRFLPQDTHIPEAASIAAPAQYTEPVAGPWRAGRDSDGAPSRPLRLFAKAEPIIVPEENIAGMPVRFYWRHALHRLAHAEGPERIATEWWHYQNPGCTRDYFRVKDEDGQHFWIYREGLPDRETLQPRWFMHGLLA
jgi:protein ImuB